MLIMAIDLGKARTGVALSDKTGLLAYPHSVIPSRNTEKLLTDIVSIIAKENVQEVIIGNPLNMDGSRGEKSLEAEAFSEMLSEKVEVPIRLWDERQSTVSAHNMLREAGKKQKNTKNIVDAVAAVVILENYLNFKRNSRS